MLNRRANGSPKVESRCVFLTKLVLDFIGLMFYYGLATFLHRGVSESSNGLSGRRSTVMQLDELLTILNYTRSVHYRPINGELRPETAHLFRAAGQANVNGIYVFEASPADNSKSSGVLPSRPAVYIASAQTAEHARKIHQSLWNLGQAPFVVILLPHQIRIYTGFAYSRELEEKGLIDSIDLGVANIDHRLKDFTAQSVDSGQVWQTQADKLNPNERVDNHLLKNLKELGRLLSAKLQPEMAHALIGKYVYIRYLKDRKVLSEEWLSENGVNWDNILGHTASVVGLQKLVTALEDRFDGDIFPLSLKGKNAPTDTDVKLIASIFRGGEVLDKDVIQLHLDFQAYDFQYIPVETLSSIYEEFLHSEGKGKQSGVIYTPEFLADYLLSEVNSVEPLHRGTKVLDPSCGSGVFLVLAYRRLIETELAKRPDKKISPSDLREILLDSIYGVERERDACYVAEFSLILTLLDYVEPPELHRNKRFKFPSLHNTRIFQSDFFDDQSEFWSRQLKFDWIIGNPPWIEINPQTQIEKHAFAWIRQNQEERPVGGYQISEAFSWRVTDLLKDDGVVGLVLHAKSLFNHKSLKYRQFFFGKHEIVRITNLANLRRILFGRRSVAPAATVVYRKAPLKKEKPYIEHYGPFLVNQVPTRSLGNGKKELWTLTINENEIQSISPFEAETGAGAVWKQALWGTSRDKRAFERLRVLFPYTLKKICDEKDWYLAEGPQLRNKGQERRLEPVPFLEGKRVLKTLTMSHSGRRFSIPSDVFDIVTKDRCYKRTGQIKTEPPHVTISASLNYAIYSDQEFLTPPRQIGLFGAKRDGDYLRAIALFLSSSLARYYLFFQVPDWGIERDRIDLRDVRNIPVPQFTSQQIKALADIQKSLAQKEVLGARPEELLKELDNSITSVLRVPHDLATLASDFVRLRLTFNEGKVRTIAAKEPSVAELILYGKQLANELDSFVEAPNVHHRVTIVPAELLIRCNVKVVKSKEAFAPVVRKSDRNSSKEMAEIQELLHKQFSQWVYVQRGLRIFDGPNVDIYKTPRLIDWSRTQAMNDADDLIGEILNNGVAANGQR